MKTNCSVLFVDDEEYIRIAAHQALTLAGFDVVCVPDAGQALPRISENWAGIVVSDLRMPGMDGEQFLQRVMEIDQQIPVILVSGHADIFTAVKSIKHGAYDFLEKPFSADQLVEVVGRALEKRALVLDNRSLRAELSQQRATTRLIGRSSAMNKLKQGLNYIATTDVDVLIHGETGSGKELVAESLHLQSDRQEHPFVAINCGAMPESLFESELFGHMRGAFTNATHDHTGKLEYANHGTFFLDEIESMPMQLQIKLLRVLQERVIQRVGSNVDIKLDIRVVAATKVDLLAAVAEGYFREDLYYRLNVVTLRIPPLRERPEDIPMLFQHFIELASERLNRDVPVVTDELLQRMLDHDWPGNVRELQNFSERVAMGLPDFSEPDGDDTSVTLGHKLDAFEKLTIDRELRKNNGNLTQTYQSLGISRKTLYDKMKKHGLSRNPD